MIAKEVDLPVVEVRKVIRSFFDSIIEARTLPFSNEKKIFSAEKFNSYVTVWNVPFIGRIGPVYSRYLKWRANESKNFIQEPRRNYRSRITQSDLELMAEEILSGKTPSPLRKRKGNEMYNRVWLVGQDGKTLARQVIPKEQ